MKQVNNMANSQILENVRRYLLLFSITHLFSGRETTPLMYQLLYQTLLLICLELKFDQNQAKVPIWPLA